MMASLISYMDLQECLPLQAAEKRRRSLVSLQEYSAALQQILPASYTDSSQHAKWSSAFASVLAGHRGGNAPSSVEDLQVRLLSAPPH